MCQVAEQVIILDALNGDTEAVAAAAAQMLPAERQAFRDALALATQALGLDCAACGEIVPVREASSRGPLGGPRSHYHPGHRPGRSGQRSAPPRR